ncbi:MAG: nuclear transport factor 2 family protein [Verrucomicrobia bacterium]|nr:nuclear transport factor 2 family protein [Verrucomicrobiota bacterium]
MTPLELARRFYELNNSVAEGNSNAAELEALLAPDFVFTGPLMKVEGSAVFMGMLRQFLPFHESVIVRQQIVSGDIVCSITQLKLKTPAGGSLTVDVSEWLKVEGHLIQSLTIFYDPRGFVQAFPM